MIKTSYTAAQTHAERIKSSAEAAREIKYKVSLSQNNKPAEQMREAHEMLNKELTEVLTALIEDTQKISKVAELLYQADKDSSGVF